MPIRETTSERERLCLLYHPFQGDETDVRLLSDKFVSVRFEQKCTICWEKIALGSRVRARREINNEDRKAGTFYFCEPCCTAMARSWKDEGRSIEERTVMGMRAAGEDPDCQKIRGLLAGLRFKNAKPRSTWIKPEQVKMIRDEAVAQNWLAIALAQAFQFDCALRQKDTIGEWVPIEDPEPSTLLSPDGQMKWVRGITREEVNDEMILTHKTSKRGHVLSFPLTMCPAVMQEWYAAPPSGPLIIDPQTDLPFEAWKYRRIWREIATKAGVPANVWNMDSRAGRITQLLADGVSLEDARKLAGHTQQSTTSRYSRGTSEAIERALKKIDGEDDEGEN